VEFAEMGLRTALLRSSLAMAPQTFLKALTCKLPTCRANSKGAAGGSEQDP